MTEPLARRDARRPRSSCARRPAAACAALALAGAWALLGGSVSAHAARLVEVRVGRHADFVRVVFETDAPAAFSVEPGEAPEERRVRIEAEGGVGAVRVPPGAGAEVTLEPLPGGATLARIRAAAPVRVESQVLDRPPRIVFDLRPGAPEPLPVPEPVEAAAEAEPVAEAPEASEPVEPGAVVLVLPALRELAVLSDLAPPLAEPAPEQPEAVEQPAPPELPPVAAAPPGAVVRRLDDRSLLVGAAAGLAIGLGFSLLGRGRRQRTAAAAGAEGAREPALEEVPSAPPPPREPPPGPAGRPPPADRLAEDVFAMLQRLDERMVRIEGALAALAERTAGLEARSGTQAEELATQRVALARLHLAVGRLAGGEAGRRPAAPAVLAASPARES